MEGEDVNIEYKAVDQPAEKTREQLIADVEKFRSLLHAMNNLCAEREKHLEDCDKILDSAHVPGTKRVERIKWLIEQKL